MQSLEIFLMATGVVLLLLTFYFGRTRQADESPPSAPREPVPDISIEKAGKLRTSLTELIQELSAMSRDMTMDLEQKLSELKDLLQLADKKLEELARASTRKKEKAEQIPEQQETKESPPEPPAPEPQPAAESEASAPQSSNRYQKIYEMADANHSIDEIARSMQMGKGEIQLILSLRKKD